MDLHSERLRPFFLGPLEQQALRVLWLRGSATLPELIRRGDFRCHINTLRTTFDRLCKKEFLVRIPERGVFRYFPRYDKHQFQQKAIEELVRALLASEEDPALCLACMVDAITAKDPALLNELFAVIESRRQSGQVTPRGSSP
jgi:predicted transcriptional regulator